MPYIPHTKSDIESMLASIGASSIEDLFAEIPSQLRSQIDSIPEGISELEISQIMHQRAKQDGSALCFIGAGAYEHHIPAAVWEIATRGEYYSAYTPYQAEASQGTLQLLYEYQSMMAALTAMDVSNASLYDGATSLAEAVLMAIRCNRKAKSKRVLMPTSVHPHYRQVVDTIVRNQGIELVPLPYDLEKGIINPQTLPDIGDFAAMVIPQPNFFGVLEQVDQLTSWAHKRGIITIACVNPMALSILSPPGEWDQHGVDIACGDGQPLGIPLASGGPYFGFICCAKQWVRQLPGRLVGRTVDRDGNTGYSLTLQAREQHIRRSKATSNICTNQGLLVTAATIYMSIMGPAGMEQTARQCHRNAQNLRTVLTRIKDVDLVFTAPHFHEFVLRLPVEIDTVLAQLEKQSILAGFDLQPYYSELGDAILVCATETKTTAEINQFAEALKVCLTK